MKKILILLLLISLSLTMFGCNVQTVDYQVVATTLPVYNFTIALCNGTDISVKRLITENVSCLHNYTLQVSQMQAIESADTVIISGAGLEDFLEESLLDTKNILDCSSGVPLICAEDDHNHADHHHMLDSHYWLSPSNAVLMADNICQGLSKCYPQYESLFQQNLEKLHKDFQAIAEYAQNELNELSCRELITFHDGFSYLAQSFDLTIVHAIEEDAGSEASAAELIELTKIVEEHKLPAIFTECNGSTSAANIISAETGAKVFSLDMAMSDKNYFEAMKYNIDTLKEALE